MSLPQYNLNRFTSVSSNIVDVGYVLRFSKLTKPTSICIHIVCTPIETP